MRKYRHHEYTWSKLFGHLTHRWELVGPSGALEFHVTMLDEKRGGASAGLEVHHREPPEHMRGEAPSQLACKLTGGWCWHDGSSLYATESLWPLIAPFVRAGNHEAIFEILEGEATRQFEGEEVDGE